MSEFKTQAEIWQYLLTGGAVSTHNVPQRVWRFEDNQLMKIDGEFKDDSYENFVSPEKWYKVKKKKTMRLKGYAVVALDGHTYYMGTSKGDAEHTVRCREDSHLITVDQKYTIEVD